MDTVDGTCALDCDGQTHWIHSTKLDGTCALDCAMDTHIGYTRPNLTEHVRSTVRHIGYTRPSLTENVRSTAMESHFVSTRPSLACDCDGLTYCMHSTKLDGTRALNFAACTTRFKNIINIYQ
ncbi:hypothetical protein LEN26_012587 [Aphanomyces euteiches]|nr:hypothetical protein LEN26_012587 [Aphanomyces euteiches]